MIDDIGEYSLQKHKELKGKIEVTLKDTLDSQLKLSTFYTPGVGYVSSYIADHESEAREYTWLNNNVAVISDGTAVLGLGDIGPLASLPVMEGKCMLLKHFANIDAVPIILDVHKPKEIISAVKAIAPSFGAINLEDIAAPTCFEVEEELIKSLNIPIMHDDQHGTAIVVLAGLINACKVVGKKLEEAKVVIIGAGAAGVAVAKLVHLYARPNITVVDSQGIIHPKRPGLSIEKQFLARFNKIKHPKNTLRHALMGADIVIGVSRANLLTAEDIRFMNKDSIVFALANPVPEIMPTTALSAGVRVVATGRSDFPNQINNVLAFPGIFRGALDNRISKITEQHKVLAAEAIAKLVKNPTPEKIVPSVFEEKLVQTVSRVIK